MPHAKAGVGAIATQAETNPLLGIWGLRLLESRKAAQAEAPDIPVGDVLDLLQQNDAARDQLLVWQQEDMGQPVAALTER